ncbi:PilZ domain-containing protein [Geothrix sp. 21YS21S-2]|uniref:PilZ domain-containing protein n=1 Tax=Geothrix sp. 21YS21S-2 TaxID=3068893 RepID=UPI0027B95628|nr:PilZ domain-containing protein [Geothrix sp. 21YS21S-2]
MAKLKAGKPADSGTRIEDPAILRDVFQQLFDLEAEFPIKVEGTSTLPYFCSILKLNWDEGCLVLKLVRPLPHELLVGAVFHFLCASGEQRYEGFITFQGREGYLQYRFERPAYLLLSDRRVHKRYPFRPRESAYVILQDSGVPGLGVAGPLVNIGLGGLALRVDRIIRLDTGVRIPPSTAIFDRGKGFPRIRVQDLPRIHLLEARGLSTHATERGNELVLGLAFTSLTPEEEALIQAALEVRDRLQRGGGPRSEGGAVALRPDGRPLLPGEGAPPDAQVAAGDILRRLRRRTSTVGLVMPEGPQRDALELRLREAGFLRLQVAGSMAQLAALAAGEPRRHAPRLCIVDLAVAHAGDAEPLEAVRSIEAEVAGLGSIPTAILCDAVDPTLLLAQADLTRFVSTEVGPESLATLDAMLDRDPAE